MLCAPLKQVWLGQRPDSKKGPSSQLFSRLTSVASLQPAYAILLLLEKLSPFIEPLGERGPRRLSVKDRRGAGRFRAERFSH